MKHRSIVPARVLPRALLDRRELLRHTAVGLAAWPLVHLACGADPLDSGLDGGLDGGLAADAGPERSRYGCAPPHRARPAG